MSKFTIAHVSDLHLTARDDAKRSEPKAWGKLRGMNGHFDTLLRDPKLRACDAIVITGDVTDRGDADAWDRFWGAVRSAGLRGRVLVIPGNHDLCCLGAVRVRPKAEYQALVRQGLAAGGQPADFPWVRRLDDRVAIFAVDAANSSNQWGVTNAVGRIDFEQLARLGKLLRAHDAVPWKFILVHHSPNIPQPSTSRRRNEHPTGFWERAAMQMDKEARRALRLLARTFGVKAILHGHTHEALDRRVAGVRLIGCPASTEPDRGGDLQYKLLQLDRETGRIRAATRKVPSL